MKEGVCGLQLGSGIHMGAYRRTEVEDGLPGLRCPAGGADAFCIARALRLIFSYILLLLNDHSVYIMHVL